MTGQAPMTDGLPPEVFLAGYPDPIRDAAEILRRVVRQAVPDAVERVRPGWRLIGYDLPVGGRMRYFAFVAPEPIHVHLGFEYGAWMADPERHLEGAHLNLKKVRFLTFQPGDAIPEAMCVTLAREAARVAVLPPAARMSLAARRRGSLSRVSGRLRRIGRRLRPSRRPQPLSDPGLADGRHVDPPNPEQPQEPSPCLARAPRRRPRRARAPRPRATGPG